MSEFVCDKCNRSFSKKFALTNHQKKCTGDQEVQEVQEVQEEVITSTTERNQLKSLIKSRADTIRKALSDELEGTSTLEDRLRLQAGLTLTSEQLKDIITRKDSQIDDLVEKHQESATTQIDIQLADVDDEYRRKEKEMKERHKEEIKRLFEEKTQKKKALREQRADVVNSIKKDLASHLIKERSDLQQQYAACREQEMEIENKVRMQTSILKQGKDRVKHVINDAENRATEELVTTGRLTRSKAKEILESIPTVQEVLEMMQNENAISTLFKRLNPAMSLPAPQKVDDSVLKKHVIIDVNARKEERQARADEERLESDIRRAQRDYVYEMEDLEAQYETETMDG